MVFLVFCFRFGFCVNTWLYLWGWFFQVYLWLDKYIVEGCMYLWLDKYMYLRVACTCELSIGTHEACYLHLCVHKYFWQECVYTCVRLLHVLVIWQNKTDKVWFLLVCILVVIPLHVETYMYIYILLWRVLASSPSVLLVDFCLCVLPHGSIGCFGARKAEARQRW